MAAPSSSVIPTPLAHADNQGEGHPRGVPLQSVALKVFARGRPIPSPHLRHWFNKHLDEIRSISYAGKVSPPPLSYVISIQKFSNLNYTGAIYYRSKLLLSLKEMPLERNRSSPRSSTFPTRGEGVDRESFEGWSEAFEKSGARNKVTGHMGRAR
ncbi:hypothetical protein TNCV_4855131 [Trichonephila clavipes]|nr:hypothetical protein TNCV_4855131 [Trichonephila clavipes]